MQPALSDTHHLTPMQGTHMLSVEDLEWQATSSQGFWLKPCFAGAKGQKTELMKIDAGAFVDIHEHDQLEQIYVMSGTFYDEFQTYRAGDFIVRSAGTPHTAGSQDGAIVLLIYTSK